MKLIKLQGIGLVEAKPANELKIGSKVIWNYGEKSIVEAFLKETEKTITVLFDRNFVRKFSKTRLLYFK